MLLERIENYLRRSRTSPTRFGRDAMGDPWFVPGLRDGRCPRAATCRRVLAYIEAREAMLPAAAPDPRLDAAQDMVRQS
jgi:hypothetical protein